MIFIQLEWKLFSVNLDKVNAWMKANMSSNYDGLVCDELCIKIVFKTDPTEDEINAINAYWAAATAETFYPTMEEIITKKVNEASIFGTDLIAKAIIENITMGITQAGKTKLIADLLSNLQYYLKTGSLYAAIAEIDRMINEGLDPNLAPFVTIDRLNTYKAKIQAYIAG